MPKLTPPRHLSPEARRLWQRLNADFVLDDGAAQALLRCACEAFDRCEGARQALASEGTLLPDRFGQPKPHPLVAVERDARAQMIAALRALKLSPGDAT